MILYNSSIPTLSMYTKAQKGFTLIELLVVITIIGVLASTVLAQLQDSRAAARDSNRLQVVKNLQTRLELYRNNNDGLYPCYNGSNCTLTPNAGVPINPVTPSTVPTINFLTALNTQVAAETGFFNVNNWGGASIVYSLRVGGRDSYTILLRLERARTNNVGTTILGGAWCRFDSGPGVPGWSVFPPCF